jgi:hypothetical protein
VHKIIYQIKTDRRSAYILDQRRGRTKKHTEVDTAFRLNGTGMISRQTLSDRPGGKRDIGTQSQRQNISSDVDNENNL